MFLGLGVGILISSAMNIAFNKPKAVEYTDEQIKEKAKSLGMISIKENIENNSEKPVQEKVQSKEEQEIENQKKKQIQEELEQTRAATNGNGEASSDDEAEKKPETRKGYKSITIENGDDGNNVIQKLRKEDLIDGSDDFKVLVTRYNLDTKFTMGTHEINVQASDRDIIEKLIQQKDLKEVGFYK